MNVILNRIGPIAKANISLDKRFYVFVGYNNSGKTYASYALWSLYATQRRRYIHNTKSTPISFPDFAGNNIEVPITTEKISQVASDYSKNLSLGLSNIFNVSPDNPAFKKARITLTGDYEKEWLKSRHKVLFGKSFQDKTSNQYILEKKSGEANFILSETPFIDAPNSKIFGSLKFTLTSAMLGNLKESVTDIVDFTIQETLFRFHHTPFFLPANRIFFPSYFKYIYSTEAKEFQSVRRQFRYTNELDLDAISEYPHTEPVNQLIEAISSLPRLQARTQYSDLLLELEEIISGQLTFSQKEGIAPIDFKLRLDGGDDIDMYLASSSSNQLSLLYLYFKYWATPDYNFLIIDEPEENLHPKNQIKVANILINFANRGTNKVLITTHSPLVAETINNNMFLSYLKEKQSLQATDYPNKDYITENALKSKAYGVYFFSDGQVSEYKPDDYGVYFRDFVQEESKIRETSDFLRHKISSLKNKHD
ncbi:AAA family ATPase [Hymenobacter sp. ASUV-10]|uniref:AAA family ATPase n=1 Tax=Hymenobacter aranciens TaxID=3063996 RepID=A0ABT9BG45_9BACT|nr:AAA family ATPase [Hymenobacter sp. ASUV-10]MDO7877234.1 AAA family ATPase [Hymenobacter sp. ASUV-10]